MTNYEWPYNAFQHSTLFAAENSNALKGTLDLKWLKVSQTSFKESSNKKLSQDENYYKTQPPFANFTGKNLN